MTTKQMAVRSFSDKSRRFWLEKLEEARRQVFLRRRAVSKTPELVPSPVKVTVSSWAKDRLAQLGSATVGRILRLTHCVAEGRLRGERRDDGLGWTLRTNEGITIFYDRATGDLFLRGFMLS